MEIEQAEVSVTAKNAPYAIVSAWTALETLSPQTYRDPADLCKGDGRCVAKLNTGALPWIAGEPTRPNYQLYYWLVLGSIRMDVATEAMVKAFGEDEETSQQANSKVVMAEILLNRHGVPFAESAIAISSFAWALPLALRSKFEQIVAWPFAEKSLQDGLTHILQRTDPQGNPVPVDWATIQSAHGWLKHRCNIPTEMVEPPSFALRHYHSCKSKTAPEPSLLNSFFLADLVRIGDHLRRKTISEGILQYLGASSKTNKVDLLNDWSTLEKAVSPLLVPAAKWPAPEGTSLVILQQAAVNLARTELRNQQGCVAVNGPPGTGKTTLLRDIVAMCVLDRATAMSTFDQPAEAFTRTGERAPAGDHAFYHLYSLNPLLKGHEILVASSNNKAVENVSKELPARKAVGAAFEKLSYFRSISNFVQASKKIADAEGEQRNAEAVETWGLIAAVLGNNENRSAFWQAFWWNKDRSFSTYLKAAKGDSVLAEVINPETGEVERKTPSVILLEKPPSPQQAEANWPKAKEIFLNLKKEVETELQALEKVRQLVLQLVEPRRELLRKEANLAQLQREHQKLLASVASIRTYLDEALEEHGDLLAESKKQMAPNPGWFARLLRSKAAKAWENERTIWQVHIKLATEQSAQREKDLKEAERDAYLTGIEARNLERLVTVNRAELAERSAALNAHPSQLEDRLVDEEKFSRGHDEWHNSIPWISSSLNRKREELFVAALSVHRAFIDAAAPKIFHNLGALIAGGAFKEIEKRRFLGDLWSTLFLVVPVISTTFASVDRMMGQLPPESLGWLLIDEAGQATLKLPQVRSLVASERLWWVIHCKFHLL